MKKRYKITLEYLGTNFKGWQKQKTSISLQETFEKAARNFFLEDVKTFVAGRTDSGVHAAGQVLHLDSTKNIPKEKILLGINFHLLNEPLGDQMAIKKVVIVNRKFNARFSAKKKIYQYIILNDYIRSPLISNISWMEKKELNLKKMRLASSFFLGKHDFSSFRSKGCQSSSPVKTIDNILITRKNKLIKINFFAKSFLYNQVRIMVGTLRDVGLGKKQPEDINYIIKKRDRSFAGVTAPSKGLSLLKVQYK